MKTLLERKFSMIIIVMELFLFSGAIGFLLYMNILPLKYLIMVVVLAVFLLAYTIVSQMADRGKLIGRMLCGLFCLLFSFFAFYGLETYKTVQGVTGTGQNNAMSYLVLKEDKAQTITDAKDYTFGILEDIDRENSENAIEHANKILNTKIESTEFLDMDALIEGLYSEKVQVIIFNESYRNSVMESHAMFEEDMRILAIEE